MELSKYTLQDIYPPLDIKEVKEFLKEYQMVNKLDLPSDFSFDSMGNNIETLLHKVYIRKNLKIKSAIKARFLQYLAYNEEYQAYKLIGRNFKLESQLIDFILQNRDNEKITLVIIVDILDNQSVTKIQRLVTEVINDSSTSFSQYQGKIEKITLVCGQINRKVLNTLNNVLKDVGFEIEILIEYKDPDSSFTDNDKIIIEDQEYGGFNFGSLDDILSLIKKEMGKGKYIVFYENEQGRRDILLEGIVFPKLMLNK